MKNVIGLNTKKKEENYGRKMKEKKGIVEILLNLCKILFNDNISIFKSRLFFLLYVLTS